jgi:hypothetical protein
MFRPSLAREPRLWLGLRALASHSSPTTHLNLPLSILRKLNHSHSRHTNELNIDEPRIGFVPLCEVHLEESGDVCFGGIDV